MAEIITIQPWERVLETLDTQYFISVVRAASPRLDQWDFGSNREMWLQVIEIMSKYLTVT